MEDRKEPQQMLPLRNEGPREPRKRKPERGASREKGPGPWVISQVGSHKSWGRTGEKADGDDSGTFSQRRSRLWAVMAPRAGGAGAMETVAGKEGDRRGKELGKGHFSLKSLKSDRFNAAVANSRNV